LTSPVPFFVGQIGKKADYPPGTKVVVYARTSGKSWHQRGNTIAFQARRITRYCEARGLKVVAVIKDASGCGSDLNRSRWCEAKAIALHNGAVLVADNIKRFTRNGKNDFTDLTPETLQLLKENTAGIQIATRRPPQIGIASAVGSSTGERALRSVCTKAGMKSSPKEAGRKTGSRNVTQGERYEMVALKNEDLSVREIAQRLGRAVKTVKANLEKMVTRITITIDAGEVVQSAIQGLVTHINNIITTNSVPVTQPVTEPTPNQTTITIETSYHQRE